MFQNLYRWRFTSILLPYLAEDLLSFSTRHHVTRTRCLYGCLETSERGPYPLRWASRHCAFQVLLSLLMLNCPSINSQCFKNELFNKEKYFPPSWNGILWNSYKCLTLRNYHLLCQSSKKPKMGSNMLWSRRWSIISNGSQICLKIFTMLGGGSWSWLNKAKEGREEGSKSKSYFQGNIWICRANTNTC